MKYLLSWVLFLFWVFSVLSACSFVPEYQRPQPAFAADWEYYPQHARSGIRQLNWREFYQSTELQQLIEQALVNNKDLHRAVLNIDAAKALYRIQRSERLPNIDAQTESRMQRSSDDMRAPDAQQKTEIYAANLGVLSYELDIFGKIRSLNAAALNSYLATRAARDTVQNALVAETANIYLQLLADKKLLALTEQTLLAQERTLEILTLSKKAGVATRQDVARAQTAVESARVNQYQYMRNIAQDKNALLLLLSVSNDKFTIPEMQLQNIALNTHIVINAPSEILLARPDVHQAELELLARNADIGAARAAFFPSIRLTGDFGFASTALSSLFSGSAFPAWSFIPQLSLPIFAAGRNKAHLELAQVRKELAVVSYESSVQRAFREIADQLVARATLSKQFEAQQRLVAAAQSVYDISYARYKYGIDSFLSVLDAQRELYVFQQNEILIERQQLANLVELYKALGGGSDKGLGDTNNKNVKGDVITHTAALSAATDTVSLSDSKVSADNDRDKSAIENNVKASGL